jgi:DNA processing protein
MNAKNSEDLAEKSLWISLSRIHGLDTQAFCQLLKVFGSPRNIYAASFHQLKSVVTDNIASEISHGVNEDALAESIRWLSLENNFLVTLADPYYPKSLLEITDPPPILYAKGKLALLNQPSIAIVGSRNSTIQGERNATAFAEGLCSFGLCIVSGLALGIDGAAHRGALQANGSTIAVVATGLDIVYPAKHLDLAHEIAKHGLLISEFALGETSKPQNFPRRNRLISGLSLGCLVVEAGLQSGSQITARLATEQGREVFAIPGSIHSPTSKGCHQLIKQGAKLVDNLQDIIEDLNLTHLSFTQKNTSEATSENQSRDPLLAVIAMNQFD